MSYTRYTCVHLLLKYLLFILISAVLTVFIKDTDKLSDSKQWDFFSLVFPITNIFNILCECWELVFLSFYSLYLLLLKDLKVFCEHKLIKVQNLLWLRIIPTLLAKNREMGLKIAQIIPSPADYRKY